MKTNKIDYSKAPKHIQDMIDEHDRLCELPDEETPELLMEQLYSAISAWEQTQKDA